MATLQQLEDAIDAFLRMGRAEYQLIRRVEEKAYEAYIFGLCLRAVREVGGKLTLAGTASQVPPFVFRGAPGKIGSKFRNYIYAEFTLNQQEFEIHAGIEVRGTSGMTHELDVCILHGAVAQRCREVSHGDPSGSSLVGGWECKFYACPLEKNLGRAFVGLVADMGLSVPLTGLCSNSDHAPLRKYFSPRSRPHPHFRLTPLPLDRSNEDIFVNQLKGALKKLTAA